MGYIWGGNVGWTGDVTLLQMNSSSLSGRSRISEGNHQQCCGNHSHRLNTRTTRRSRSSWHSSLSSSSTFSLSFILLTFFIGAALKIGQSPVSAYGETVYIRKVNGFSQLLSSDTLRWFKHGTAKEPLKLLRPTAEPAVICRVWHTSMYTDLFSGHFSVNL